MRRRGGDELLGHGGAGSLCTGVGSVCPARRRNPAPRHAHPRRRHRALVTATKSTSSLIRTPLLVPIAVPAPPPDAAAANGAMDEVVEQGEGFVAYCMKGKGWKRVEMEDRHVAAVALGGDRAQALFGVFDGHCGKSAAKFAAENMPRIMAEELGRGRGVEHGRRQGYAPVCPGIPYDFGPKFFCIRPKPISLARSIISLAGRWTLARSYRCATDRGTEATLGWAIGGWARRLAAGQGASAAPPHRRPPPRLRRSASPAHRRPPRASASQSQMKKKNGAGPAGSSIFAMWNKSSKAKKIAATSTPNQSVVESNASHDIVHAIQLLDDTKYHLGGLRSDPGWEGFLIKVTSFCTKHRIKVVDMKARYYPVGRPRRGDLFNGADNYHRFHVDMFVSVIDRQISELNGRFDEVNTELLICMAAFSPVRSFAAYDQNKLVKLASQFYATDFATDELARLPWQLDMYITHVRRDERFKNLKNIVELSVMLVETNMHAQYFIVYKLLKLVLILPVATASVERVFSSMNYVKNKLRNKMSDDYLNNCMVTFVERELFNQVKDEDIINLFQKGARKVIL